jgi:phosphatidylserine/phosphatidylglycerophosphate/cardiolipin synthase-like enzyme
VKDDLHRIATAATELADRLPNSVMVILASAVAQHGHLGWPTAQQAILAALPTPDFRNAASNFLDIWRFHAAGVGPDAAAIALLAVAESDLAHRLEEMAEVAWTGPETVESHFRQTEQAILEVINSATCRLTIVSYAVYRIPRIREALIAAAGRGIDITVIVETPNRIEGQNEYDCLLALGQNVAAASSVYYWPREHRPKDDNGKIGILHVKCAVADGRRLFLSSANFTEYAFTINMELGLLVTGGRLPGQVERHFERLIDTGQLKKL